MDDGLDYSVRTKVKFRLDFDGSGDFNTLLLPDVQRAFVQHVKGVYEQDETLSTYIPENLNFHCNGRWVELDYTFSCHDESEAEAESFSSYCVRGIQEELEAFGCKLTQISCKAEKADRTWLDELENAIFGPKEQLQQGGMEMM